MKKAFTVIWILACTAATVLNAEGLAQKPSRRSVASGDKIQWTHDLNAGLVLAISENKPVMVDFVADWCVPCRIMNESTFSNAEVVRKAKAFIRVRIDIDKQQAERTAAHTAPGKPAGEIFQANKVAIADFANTHRKLFYRISEG